MNALVEGLRAGRLLGIRKSLLVPRGLPGLERRRISHRSVILRRLQSITEKGKAPERLINVYSLLCALLPDGFRYTTLHVSVS